MKKSTKKHRFFHADPETQKDNSVKTSDQKDRNNLDLPQYVLTDLKKTILVITVFIAILVIFYLTNNKYDFLGLLKNKFF